MQAANEWSNSTKIIGSDDKATHPYYLQVLRGKHTHTHTHTHTLSLTHTHTHTHTHTYKTYRFPVRGKKLTETCFLPPSPSSFEHYEVSSAILNSVSECSYGNGASCTKGCSSIWLVYFLTVCLPLHLPLLLCACECIFLPSAFYVVS